MPRLLPNWIQAYLLYTHQSESPEAYHTWTALSTIAGAVRRKAFFNMEYFQLYPNLFAVLVGPPGRCKKSTAMRIGRTLLGEIPDIQFTTDSVTRERLIQDLSQSFRDGHSSMTAFSSEFASLLTSSGMDMVVFLTDIYECPPAWSHKTKMGGTNEIKAPYLNLLGATTPDWIARSLPLDTVGIGLTSRIVFIYADTPRVRPWRPVLTPEQKEIGKLLAADLQDIATISGEYQFSGEADALYDEWYRRRIDNPNPTGDSRLNGYYERKPMHVIKLAMLIAASKRSDPIIELVDLQDTFTLLDQTEEKMPRVFAAVGKNPLAYDQEQVLVDILSSPAGISWQTLLAKYRHSVRKEELAEIVETLATLRLFDIKQTADGPVYFPKPVKEK